MIQLLLFIKLMELLMIFEHHIFKSLEQILVLILILFIFALELLLLLLFAIWVLYLRPNSEFVMQGNHY